MHCTTDEKAEKDAQNKMNTLRILSQFRGATQLRELYQDIQAICNHGDGPKLAELDWEYIMSEAEKRWAADMRPQTFSGFDH